MVCLHKSGYCEFGIPKLVIEKTKFCRGGIRAGSKTSTIPQNYTCRAHHVGWSGKRWEDMEQGTLWSRGLRVVRGVRVQKITYILQLLNVTVSCPMTLGIWIRVVFIPCFPVPAFWKVSSVPSFLGMSRFCTHGDSLAWYLLNCKACPWQGTSSRSSNL